jgi:hypothetical protein
LILDNIVNKWASISAKEKEEAKTLSLQALISWPSADDAPYLRKKLASIPAEVAKREWPQR